MATTTLTPYAYHHIWVSAYSKKYFSNVPSTNQGTDTSVYDAAQYIGNDKDYYDSVTRETYSGAVCIEYNVSLNNAYISSITMPTNIEIYVAGTDNYCHAILSTSAPTENSLDWKFETPTKPPTNTRLGSSIKLSTCSSLTFSNINKTITTSKIYLYLYTFGPNDWENPKGCSFTAGFKGNGTVTYTPSTYTVSYSANGHGTAPQAQTKTHDVALTLQPFISNVTTGGTNATVTITGNANGTTWNGSHGSATYTTERHVYSQTSWKANDGTTYSSRGSYTANAATTMTAQWSDTKTNAAGTSYTLPTGTPTKSPTTTSIVISFNSNGGNSSKISEVSSQQITYTFDGWYTAASGGTRRTDSSRVTAEETVYAQMTATAGAYSAVTCPTVAECIRYGYELLGWSTDSMATNPTYLPGQSISNITGPIILYAIWNKIDFSFVHIYSPSNNKFIGYQPYIYHDNNYYLYDAYVYNGTEWVCCGGDPYANLITNDGKYFVTNDNKIFQVYSPESIED